MRISSLARKIKIKPSELITYCEQNNIELDSGAHTKLSEDQVEKIYTEFAPEFLKQDETAEAVIAGPLEDTEEVELKPDPEVTVEVSVEENSVAIEEDIVTEEAAEETQKEDEAEDDNEAQEEIEVIRAPKITLPGLKVKGKIDLPEPKKPEPKEEKKREEEKTKNRKKSGRNRKGKNGDDFNPVAAARKRKQEREEKDRAAALKKKKKAKAQHYYKMQSKVAKKKEPQKEILQTRETRKEQVKDVKRNVFQRFWRWFNT